MVRDEKERERRRQEERAKDEKTLQDKRSRAPTSRQTTAASVSRMQSSKPRSLHITNRNENGSLYTRTSNTAFRPRVVTSTDSATRSFRMMSGNANQIPNQAKAGTEKSTVQHTPSVWKPTPTKTSILRAAAVKSAKDARSKAALITESKRKSPVRGTGFTFPRYSPSRPVIDLPENCQRNIDVGGLSYPKYAEIAHNHLSTNALDLSQPPTHQTDENSPFEDPISTSSIADPILTLRSPFEMNRRHQNSTGDSGHRSSEKSVETSACVVRGRSHTPQSPSTNQNEEFSPCLTSRIESSPLTKDHTSPSTAGLPRYLRHTLSSPIFRRKESASSSTRLLVNSRTERSDLDLPFERFESDDEYEQFPKTSPVRPCLQTAVSKKLNSSERRYKPTQHQPHGASLEMTSTRAQNEEVSFWPNPPRNSVGRSNSSKVKSILIIGHGNHDRRKKIETRESIKLVKWDPAIVAVGPCYGHTATNESDQSNDPYVLNQEVEGDPPNFTMDEYLNSVTQSFAKLKKANPKVISQLLAALKDLKSDDESNTDTEPKRKLRLKSKVVIEHSPNNAIATKVIEKENSGCEPSSLIQDKPASMVEKMKHIEASDGRVAMSQKRVEDAKKDKRWGEVHPNVFLDFSVEATNFTAAVDRAKASTSNTHTSRSLARNQSKEAKQLSVNHNKYSAQSLAIAGSAMTVKCSSPSRLNPLAPTFRDFPIVRLKTQGRKWRNTSVSPKQSGHTSLSPLQGHKLATLKVDWRQNSRSPLQKRICAWEKSLTPVEPLWIDTSQLRKTTSDHATVKDCLPTKEMLSPERRFNFAPIHTQPQIFTVPPGFIPLIPHPGYLPQVTPYSTTYPDPISFSPSLHPVPLLGTDVDCLDDSLPSENQHGRESQLLEAAWSHQVLKSFQSKYPLTGTRAAPEVPSVTSVEPVKPDILVIPPVAEFLPRLKPILVEHVKSSTPFIRNSEGNPQQLAKKTSASVIQQALEIKILQFKEKKAAEIKEVQKKQIEKVEKILPLVRRKIMAKSADDALVIDDYVGEIWQRWQSTPNWTGTTSCSSEDLGQRSARRGKADSATHCADISASIPEHGWEQVPPKGEDFAQAQTDHDALSRSSSSTVVATYGIDVTTKPWGIHSANEWRTQNADNPVVPSHISSATLTEHHVADGQPSKCKKASHDLSSIDEWRSQAARDSRAALLGKIPIEESVSNSLSARNREPKDAFCQNKGPACGSALFENLNDKVSPLDEASLESQGVKPEITRGSLRQKKLRVNSQLSQETKRMPSTLPDEEIVQIHDETIVEPAPASPDLLVVPNHSNGASDSDSPWELLTAAEWEFLTGEKSLATDQIDQITETEADGQFRAPRYLWDFLNLEFKLEDLENLSSTPRAASGSSFDTASEAHSDALLVAQRHLSLLKSKSKRRGDASQDFFETSPNTSLPDHSKDNVEASHQQVHLNFDWIRNGLRKNRTADISIDCSEATDE